MRHSLVSRCRIDLLLTGVGVLAGLSSPCYAQTYDAAKQFDPVNNPTANGWSYGEESFLSAPLQLYTDSFGSGGLEFWSGNGREPLVVYNPTGSTADHIYGTSVIPAGQLAFHPGPNGEYSVIRWTAPTTGSYKISASFIGFDDVDGTTTDVHVLDNGTSLFARNILGYQNTASYSTVRTIQKGSTVDFAVGFGPDGNYFGDTTGVSAKITSLSSVPETSSALILSGFLAIGLGMNGSLRRKRNQSPVKS